MKISIPEPCHEDWDKMTPADKGNFCSSCSKIVVDFTSMNDHEVIQYFASHKKQKTCGRFLNTQLHKETNSLDLIDFNIPISKLPPIKSFTHRFAVALLMVFGSSLFIGCNLIPNEIKGKIIKPHIKGNIVERIDTSHKLETPLKDSSIAHENKMQPIQIEKTGEAVLEPIYETGDVELIPDEPNEILMGEPIYIEPPQEEANTSDIIMGDTIAPEQIEID